MTQQGIVKACYRNIGIGRKILDKVVPAGTVIISGGAISRETLESMEASQENIDEESVAANLNLLLSFGSWVYSSNLGSISEFETPLKENETWEERANSLTVDISEFKMDKIDFVKLMSMTRFIWGEAGILAESVEAAAGEYSWFRQLFLRGKVILPEIISKYSNKAHAEQSLIITTKMSNGMVLTEDIAVIDKGNDNYQLLTQDRVVESGERINLDNVGSELIRQLKIELKIDEIVNEILLITGIKKLIKLFKKDKNQESISIEEYKKVAAAA
ncbi:MAG: hypothetical protein GY817_04860 [bacterium]|nr:hypothetical protein [bacterium]